MAQPVRIALAQLNSHLGNVEANDRLTKARETAAGQGADMIVTPKCICRDIRVTISSFGRFYGGCCRRIRPAGVLTADGGPAIVVGAPFADAGHIYNAVFVLENGRQLARVTGQFAELQGV